MTWVQTLFESCTTGVIEFSGSSGNKRNDSSAVIVVVSGRALSPEPSKLWKQIADFLTGAATATTAVAEGYEISSQQFVGRRAPCPPDCLTD